MCTFSYNSLLHCHCQNLIKMGFYILVIFTILIGQVICRRQYIDLTHPITEQMVTVPGMPEYNFTNLYASDEKGHWLMYNKFQMSEHAGTHMDSPAHFIRHSNHLGEIPLEKLTGPGVVIDITTRAATNRQAEMDVADLERWENTYGTIPPGAFVFLNSGWTKKYPNTTAIFGVDISKSPSSEYTIPVITKTAANWLIEERDINGFGTDTPSPDPMNAGNFDVHLTILGANKVILENVANLHKIPPAGAMVYALPIRLEKGSGGPIRVFAIVDDGKDSVQSSTQRYEFKLIIGAICSVFFILLKMDFID